jgi:hypothetical protein
MPSVKQRRKKRRVDRWLFKEVMAKLERSGLPDEIEAKLNPHETGAPRQVTSAVFLTALILVFGAGGTATLTRVHQFLIAAVDRNFQVELGIRAVPYGPTEDEGALSYRQVQYWFHQVLVPFDPSKSDELFERKRRRDFLKRLETEWTQILIPAAAFAGVPARAVDSTPIEAWYFPWSHWDKEATTGHRTLTGSDKRALFYGYRALTYCHATETPYIEAFNVRPANEGEAAANLELTTALAEVLARDGRSLGIVLADRGFSELQVENWVMPMRALGAEPVFDYKDVDRGVVMLLGALITDGRPHCPCMPEELRVPARPPRIGLGPKPGEKAADRRRAQWEKDHAALEAAKAVIRERADYLGTHVAGNGYGEGDVYRCPALDGKVRCTRRPDSQFLPNDGRPDLHPDDSVEYGQFCREDAIALPPEAQAKLRQRYIWMGPRWRFWYRKRTYAEGVFGNLKNQQTGSVTRGGIHVAGLMATTLMLWAAANHYNLRIAMPPREQTDWGFVDLPRGVIS